MKKRDDLFMQQMEIEKCKLAIELSSECILWVNKDGIIEDCNKSFCENTTGSFCSLFISKNNHHNCQLIGKNIIEVDMGFTSKQDWEDKFREIKNKNNLIEERVYLDKDNKKIIVESSFNFVRFYSKEYCLIAIRNIQERKNNQKKIEKITRELIRSNKDLEDFAYVASHDLQEPLRKIVQFGDLLEESDFNNMSDVGKDYLKRMINAAKRMQTFIEGLLNYSRLNTLHSQLQNVDLNKVIEDILLDLDILINKEKAKIKIYNLPKIKAIPYHMKQLFQNLINNAIKFHKIGIPPEIYIYSAKIKIKNKEYHRISIKDNGIGFEEKYSSKIFDVFYRLHGRKEYSGSGIGLAICKKIIEKHNGHISVKSEKNNGTTFLIDIPIISCK